MNNPKSKPEKETGQTKKDKKDDAKTQPVPDEAKETIGLPDVDLKKFLGCGG